MREDIEELANLGYTVSFRKSEKEMAVQILKDGKVHSKGLHRSSHRALRQAMMWLYRTRNLRREHNANATK